MDQLPIRLDKPEVSAEDLANAAALRAWLEARSSDRAAWKKLSNLAAVFGAKRLTEDVKRRMTEALLAQGITLSADLNDLDRHDTVVLQLGPRQRRVKSLSPKSSTDSDQLPDQIIAWHQHNIAEEAFSEDDIDSGEYLRCLKSTPRGGRQFVWEGSSGRGIVGVVTFGGGTPRHAGTAYEKWGSFVPLHTPLSREQLLANPATRTRFDDHGIRALQGSPIHLDQIQAKAIVQMIGGLGSTLLPSGTPDEEQEVLSDLHLRDLPAETFTEEIIHGNAQLWRALGLKGQPKRQVHLGVSGRADMVWKNTVIEVKKAVTTVNGPNQIIRYLEHLSRELGLRPDKVRGILVQRKDNVPPGVREMITQSLYPLELWSVRRDEDGDLCARRLV